MKYRLGKDIFYRQYGEYTLLFQTGTKKVFLFNSSAAEILDCFIEYEPPVKCVEILQGRYSLSESARHDILAFIEQMASCGILTKETSLVEDRYNAEVLFKDKHLSSGTLYSALFELTYRCNEKCRHCYCVQSEENELTTEEVKRTLDDLAQMNAFEVVFTGGDIFVRKDAFEILEYAYSKKLLVSIFTNGIALSDSDLLRLKAIYPKAIHFSIYSHIAKKHDAFTQVEGSFEKTISVIRKCVLLGIPVNIKSVAMEYNYEDIEGLLQLARTLGTTIQVGVSVNAKNDGDQSPIQFRLSSVERYADVIQKVSDNIEFRCSQEYLPSRDKDDKLCNAGNTGLSINPYGDVLPCNALQLKCGNVREQSLREIWENSAIVKKMQDMRFSNLKGCENCPDMEICNFCPGAAMSETGDPLCRYEEACNIVSAKKIVQIKKRR